MFRINDIVWAMCYGWGIVVPDALSVDYPVRVQFDNDTIHYNHEGVEDGMVYRTLFFEEIPIPESALKHPVSYAQGEVIMICNALDINLSRSWHPRIFLMMREDDVLAYAVKLGDGFVGEAGHHMSVLDFNEKFNGE